MLGIEELLELEEAIREELNDNLTGILTKLNRAERLEELLSLLELEHLLEQNSDYQVYKTGKIIVIGQLLLAQPDTIRNNMKHFPEFDHTGFRKCQISAIENLDISFAENRPKALVQMATGAGKTFTAITAACAL